MKIAVWVNLPSGGGSRALHQHIKGLHGLGHELALWCSPLTDLEYLNVASFATIHTVPLASFSEKTSFGEKIKGFFFENSAHIEQMKAHCQRCVEEMTAWQADILFANTCMHYAVPFIGRYFEGKKVLYLGEPMRHLYEAQPKLRWEGLEPASPKWFRRSYWKEFWVDFWANRAYRVLVREERRNFLSFDTVLVNSYFTAENCVRVYGKAPEVCYLGIDTSDFYYSKEKPSDFVISVGAFVESKNPALAIEAISLINKQIRPRLVWIANAFDRELVQKMKALAQEKNVMFDLMIGVSEAALRVYLNKAICFVYTPRLEPFGLAPLEANASGLPVVGVAQGGIRETLREGVNGLMAQPNAPSIAQKIEQLITDTDLRKHLSQEARAYVEDHWGIEKSIKRLEGFLKI